MEFFGWTALVGLAGILGAVKIGRLLAGVSGALACGLLLAAYPAYYGHMFINSKDIPFAAGYIWSLYFLLIALRQYPRVRTSTGLKLGIAMGLTMGIRVGGLLLYVYLAVLVLVCVALDRELWRDFRGKVGNRAAALAKLALSLPLSYGLMLLVWAWAWKHPFSGPWMALKRFEDFPWSGSILFRGRLVSADEVPWDYLPVYLLVQMPEIVLLSLLLSGGWAAYRVAGGKTAVSSKAGLSVALLAVAVTFPLIYAIVRSATLYDAARHFLFIVPPLVCLAGAGLATILGHLGKCARKAALILVLSGALSLIPHLRLLGALHPYEYIYYNWLAGGFRRASERFERDYWATSFKEAVEKMVERLAREEPGRMIPYRVAVTGPTLSAASFFPREWSRAEGEDRADFVIALWRNGRLLTRVEGKVFTEVKREGVLLSIVLDRRRILSSQ